MLTQYGKCSYVLPSSLGGTNGMTIRKTFERKNATTTNLGARKGGSHSGRAYNNSNPKDTIMLTMASEYEETIIASVQYDIYMQKKEQNIRLIMKRYASPGGGRITKVLEKNHCASSAASGALKGLLLEKKDEKGRTPSRPSSCMT